MDKQLNILPKVILVNCCCVGDMTPESALSESLTPVSGHHTMLSI